MSNCDSGTCHLPERNNDANKTPDTNPGTNPGNDNKPPKGFLGRAFNKVAAWGGPVLSALVAFKACCWAPKAILVATGVGSTMSAGAGYVALAFSVAAAGGGLYLWNKFRGKVASKIEKSIVIGATVLSLGYSAYQAFKPHKEACNDGHCKPQTEQVVTPAQEQQVKPKAPCCHK